MQCSYFMYNISPFVCDPLHTKIFSVSFFLPPASQTQTETEWRYSSKGWVVVVVLIQVSNVSKSIQKHWEGRTCGSKSVFTASHQVLRFSTKKGGRLMYIYYTYPILFHFASHLFLSLVSRALLSIFPFLWNLLTLNCILFTKEGHRLTGTYAENIIQ